MVESGFPCDDYIVLKRLEKDESDKIVTIQICIRVNYCYFRSKIKSYSSQYMERDKMKNS